MAATSTLTDTATTRDVELAKLVCAELHADTRVNEVADKIRVSIIDHAVVLTGVVETYAQRLAARDAAHRVAGVLDVADDIRVLPPLSQGERSDAQIAHAVRNALEWDASVPNEMIHSTVYEGWVTLTGAVPNWSQRSHAEQCLHGLIGVRGICNQITVSAPTVSPAQLPQTIFSALERQTLRDARSLVITADAEGRVTVSGPVHSWAEKQAVLGAAGHAPGVTALVDRLVVHPFPERH